MFFYLSLLSLLSICVETKSSCDDVVLVRRNAWNANEPSAINNLTSKPLSFYVIHHSSSPPRLFFETCYDDETCAKAVKSIQTFHQETNRWADIGYHFLIGENGKVYEGRGWDRQAAHSPGWNSDAYGICIIGNFIQSAPNEKAMKTLNSWMQCGIELGYVSTEHYILTHRQTQQPKYTECPGDAALNRIKQRSRWCSFQNTGVNLMVNNTIISEARRFCAREFNSPISSASMRAVSIIFNLILTVFLF